MRSTTTSMVLGSTTTLALLIGLVSCCMSLPFQQVINDKPFYLARYTECRGPKVFEIDNVQDIDECKRACVQYGCSAVNLFKLSPVAFKCELLAYVTDQISASGAVCYYSYY